MSSYAEIAWERKKARVLYLELKALGLELHVKEDPRDAKGYRLSMTGTRSLSQTHAGRLRRRVQECKPGLLRVLLGRWDADLTAVRREGETGEGS